MGTIEERRIRSQSRLTELQKSLGEADTKARDKACVYLTGSFARGEASEHSDLDIFIVGKGKGTERALSRLDEICIKADLIEATRTLQFPDFSGDGAYLVHHTVGDLVSTLGTPEDDASNTFTARLLLLLESEPLLGTPIYDEIIGEVVAAYWRDYEDHKTDFMPAFLANDILRLWRTFCVNYEARTRTEPERKKAKRKLKNYKLKHSRLLTCYSALVYLLAVFRQQDTVHPEDVIDMIRMSPTERLEWLAADEHFAAAKPHAEAVLRRYERFLEDTNVAEDELIDDFLDREKSKAYMESANELGNEMFELLAATGDNSSFYRLLVV